MLLGLCLVLLKKMSIFTQWIIIYTIYWSSIRGVNGLYIYSTVTVDYCWICDSLPTVCQWLVNGLEINLKTGTIFLKLNVFVYIVVAEKFIFDSYSDEI